LEFTLDILQIFYSVHTFMFPALVVHILKMFRSTLNLNLHGTYPVYLSMFLLSILLHENKECKVRQKMYTRRCYLPKVKFLAVQ